MLGLYRSFYFVLSIDFQFIMAPSGELHCNSDLAINFYRAAWNADAV